MTKEIKLSKKLLENINRVHEKATKILPQNFFQSTNSLLKSGDTRKKLKIN